LANADAKQKRKQAKPLQGTAINTSKFPHPINISRASITEWTNQPNKYQQEMNKMLLRIKEVFEDEECKYLGPADPPPGKEKERVLQHHIFSTKAKGEDQEEYVSTVFDAVSQLYAEVQAGGELVYKRDVYKESVVSCYRQLQVKCTYIWTRPLKQLEHLMTFFKRT
jgi:hypothetical protein